MEPVREEDHTEKQQPCHHSPSADSLFHPSDSPRHPISSVSSAPALVDFDNGYLYQPLINRSGLGSIPPNATSQTAIIGIKSSHIESLDYEIIESDVFKQDWRSRTRLQILQYIILKWVMAFLVGLSCGLVAFLINMAVENIVGAKMLQTETYLANDRNVMAFIVLAGSNIALVLFSSVLCCFIAPAAAGSGIPEVKAYLNGVDAPNILGPKTLFVKIFGSIGSVAGGLDVGKEGPLVHVGACVASLLSQGGSTQYKLTGRWLRYFKNDRDRRDLVTCGAAAGVAGAFRAPVGGVLFALEEAASWWRSSLLWRAFFTTASCAIALRLAINYCASGRCGVFGTGGLIMFEVESVSTTIGYMELVPVIMLGLVGGCLGSVFNYLNGKMIEAYSAWHTRYGTTVKLLQACIVALFTSLVMFALPWSATCTPCPDDEDVVCPSTGVSGIYKQFTCPSGYYNDLASLLLNTNENVIKNLFSTGTSEVFHYSSLVIFLPCTFVLALITYGTAIPSGLFIPAIIMGAAYGRLIGKFMTLIEGFDNLDDGLYAYLGAASFLGGSMRMTVSLCVILLELTNNLLMLPLTMFVLLISKTVGDLFTQGVYDQIVHIKGLPFLEEKPEPYMKHLTTADVCSSPAVTLSAIERVGNIVEVLKLTDHNGFPVLEHDDRVESPVLYGLILRSNLLVLLKQRVFFRQDVPKSERSTPQFNSIDFAKPGSGKGLKIEDIVLTMEEQNMFLDLHPYTNTSPYTVSENMSLAKAFLLFRQLGLRHLSVVPKTPGQNPIIGILTRHDFMSEHVLGLYPHLKASKWGRLRLKTLAVNAAATCLPFLSKVEA